jgi:hypothetical protein
MSNRAEANHRHYLRNKEVKRQHYLENKDLYRRRANESRQRRFEWYRNLKDQKPCADCGQVFPYFVLDFDHRPNSKKIGNISAMIYSGVGRHTILTEIDKCDLVCANCHRFRTQGALAEMD